MAVAAPKHTFLSSLWLDKLPLCRVKPACPEKIKTTSLRKPVSDTLTGRTMILNVKVLAKRERLTEALKMLINQLKPSRGCHTD